VVTVAELRIGVLVAQRCNSFGMRLTAFDPYTSPAVASTPTAAPAGHQRRESSARTTRPPASATGMNHSAATSWSLSPTGS
jgi:hypothetical protein